MFSQLKDRILGSRPDISKTTSIWLSSDHELVIKRKEAFKTRGYYKDYWPKGAVIHYTASKTSEAAITAAHKNGYNYLIVDQMGEVIQGAPLNRWGSHAGESFWPGLGKAVSQHLIGIEVVCPGLLNFSPSGKLFTWWGMQWSKSDARQDKNGRWFAVFTEAQEKTLLKILFVLKAIRPTIFDFNLVLGHNEVSPGRKIDPGASLSCSMQQLRQKLIAEWEGKQALA